MAADTAIWRAVVPCPDWWPTEPGAYVIFGVPPQMLLAFKLHDGNVAWQVGTLPGNRTQACAACQP